MDTWVHLSSVCAVCVCVSVCVCVCVCVWCVCVSVSVCGVCVCVCVCAAVSCCPNDQPFDLGLRCAVGFLDGSPSLKQLFLLCVPLCFAIRRWPIDTKTVQRARTFHKNRHAQKNLLRSQCPLCSTIYVQLYADMSGFTLIGCAHGDVQLYAGMSSLTRLYRPSSEVVGFLEFNDLKKFMALSCI